LDEALRRNVPEFVHHEITHELAEIALVAGRQDEAVRRFSNLLEGADRALARRAGLRLAEIALAEQRTEDCLELWHRMLADPSKSDAAAILHLMGAAFEQAGDYRQAAVCFAGQSPAQ
jgi:tetratricopeptide (TPR) repeat protein